MIYYSDDSLFKIFHGGVIYYCVKKYSKYRFLLKQLLLLYKYNTAFIKYKQSESHVMN